MTPPSISEPVWHALGWAMLHFLWIGAGVGLLCWMVERLLLRRATPNVRYGFGLVSLTVLAMSAGICVWHEWPKAEVGMMEERALSQTTVSALAEVIEGIAPPVLLAFPAGRVEVDVSGVATAVEMENVTGAAFDWVALLPGVWLIGSTGFALFLGLGLIGTWRLRRGASLATAREIRERCDHMRTRLGMRARVGVAVSERVGSPLLLGIFRPLIVLPTSAVSGMPAEMIEWILLHELAHVRRLDNAVIILQRVLECVLFFHPCVWLVSRWMDREREFCCDRFALAHNAGRDPADYAATLARLAGVPEMTFAPVAAMANHAVVQRIRRVLNAKRNDLRSGGGGGAAVGVFLIGLLSSAMMLWAFSEPEPEVEKLVALQNEAVDDPRAVDGEGADRLWKTEDGPPADLRPIEPVAEQPIKSKTSSQSTAPALVSKAYNAYPSFMSYIGGRDKTLQSFLEKRGFEFPEGAFAFFVPSSSRIMIRHNEETIERIERELEAVSPKFPHLQVALETKLHWNHGDRDGEVSVPPVWVRVEQPIVGENDRENIVLGDQAAEPDAIPCKLEVSQMDIRWVTDPRKVAGVDIYLKGEISLRVRKGTDPIESLKNGETFDRFKARDEYRVPFDETVRSRESFTINFDGLDADSRKGITAQLTATLVDPSGQPVTDEMDYRKSFPPFKMRPISEREGDRERSEHAAAAAQVAFDSGDYRAAEAGARIALSFDPENAERQAFWTKAFGALRMSPNAESGVASEWMDRTYRIHPSVLPADCFVGGDEGAKALRTFLVEQGMDFPEGATATLEDDRMTVTIHNLNSELKKLGEAKRLFDFGEANVAVTVEMLSGKPAAMNLVLGAPPNGLLGLAGVFTVPQYEVIKETAESEGVHRTVRPSKEFASLREIDVLEGLPLEDTALKLRLSVCEDEYTMDTSLTLRQTIRKEGTEKLLMAHEDSTIVTIWDGQWIALRIPSKDGAYDLVFVRLGIVKE